MKATISARPVFYFTLRPEQVALLMRLSSLHYDARCKAAGCVGGFLYGWNSHATWAQEVGETDSPVTATWGDLDTTAKILEAGHYQSERASWPLVLELSRFISSCYETANRCVAPLKFTCESP